jgi:hypothetical protein
MQGGSNELSKSNVREILSHGKDRSCIIGSVVGFMSWWIVRGDGLAHAVLYDGGHIGHLFYW